jgi:hypothetical protein
LRGRELRLADRVQIGLHHGPIFRIN